MQFVLLTFFFKSQGRTCSATTTHQDVLPQDLRVVASQVGGTLGESSKHCGKRWGEVRVADNSGEDAWGVLADRGDALGQELLTERRITQSICRSLSQGHLLPAIVSGVEMRRVSGARCTARQMRRELVPGMPRWERLD